ncbi:hypothetical protein FOXB_17077 [Fusarium oxysporum f. sp. conglutinans Fo5176]|uniref:Uncharacterized protein n=1 Tax=Fusarium oxysporum (strain Fo5176) TaxID=660025 RepID=F9GEJ3_FUSOF|nr:hypothetical protein FOXB_17077 [Fusarium oxysporum f. sp. conglutinans Fo5176]KAG6988688.1 hypothetical protein FocnCong_v001801 [Fusarium oxysporum f. sp. conglutinans]
MIPCCHFCRSGAMRVEQEEWQSKKDIHVRDVRWDGDGLGRRLDADELPDLELVTAFRAGGRGALSIDVVTDRSVTTQGDTINPTGRFYPRRIVPTEQEKVWADLAFSPSFAAQSSFPSRHQLEYVESLLHPISSEIDLRNSERDVVENAVQKLVDATYADLTLRNHLDINGTLTFESHTNLGIADESLSESMDQVSLSSRPSARTSRRRKARGKGNRADQFCISRTSDGQRFPAVAIEYKAPHKLSRDEVITGLGGEIQPDRDVINQEGEGFEFEARRLTTA